MLSIVPISQLPNIDGVRYGWTIWVGESERPVEWIQVLTAHEGESLGNGHTEGSFSTEDGQVVTTRRSEIPNRGFLHNEWFLAGHHSGRYDVRVAFPSLDRPEEHSSFLLGEPLGACPYNLMHLDFIFAKHQEGGDPEQRDLSVAYLTRIAQRLIVFHGFHTSDLQDAYWQIRAHVMRTVDGATAFGTTGMRAIADFQGKAIRAATGITVSAKGTMSFEILFESPLDQMATEAALLADRLAAELSPHARIMCDDWIAGQHAEEARLEQIRKELVGEMEEIRRQRAERERQRKDLVISPDKAP